MNPRAGGYAPALSFQLSLPTVGGLDFSWFAGTVGWVLLRRVKMSFLYIDYSLTSFILSAYMHAAIPKVGYFPRSLLLGRYPFWKLPWKLQLR